MNAYTAKDVENFMNRYEQHITHVIVAHTPFHTCNKTDNQIEKMAAQAKLDCRYALNCFYKLLYPTATNKPVRQPLLFKPLTFVTIEGAKTTTDPAQTIHFNIALGNLPTVLTTADIEALFRHAWHDKAHQSTDVKAYGYYKVDEASHWAGYSLKEAQKNTRKAWDTNSIWDVSNCWIPHAALNAD